MFASPFGPISSYSCPQPSESVTNDMAQNQSEPTNMHDALDASTCGNVAISDQLAQNEVEELTDEYLTTASPVRSLGPKENRPVYFI